MSERTAKTLRKEAIKVSDKLTPEIFKLIHDTTQKSTHAEQFVKAEGNEFFNADEASGGNFDDAYELGEEDGEIIFARELLAKINALSEAV